MRGLGSIVSPLLTFAKLVFTLNYFFNKFVLREAAAQQFKFGFQKLVQMKATHAHTFPHAHTCNKFSHKHVHTHKKTHAHTRPHGHTRAHTQKHKITESEGFSCYNSHLNEYY